MKETLPTTPYLIRAIYEWCCDSGQSPYIAVKVDAQTRVPPEHVKDGEIVLNISPDATRNLKIDNDLIRFSARFNGVSREIAVPVAAVKGIFARESGQGLAFQLATQSDTENEPQPGQSESDAASKPAEPTRGRAKLQIVK
ncbi:MAG: ClpXP protease specificity-enhancing factor [Betaproteobacteria bacterium]|nr:MAG: ClpXP protease specificity-enhancing factor [Betaproteobacteria bacterium]